MNILLAARGKSSKKNDNSMKKKFDDFLHNHYLKKVNDDKFDSGFKFDNL